MCSKLYDKFSRELIPHMQKRTSPSKVRFLTGPRCRHRPAYVRRARLPRPAVWTLRPVLHANVALGLGSAANPPRLLRTCQGHGLLSKAQPQPCSLSQIVKLALVKLAGSCPSAPERTTPSLQMRGVSACSTAGGSWSGQIAQCRASSSSPCSDMFLPWRGAATTMMCWHLSSMHVGRMGIHWTACLAALSAPQRMKNLPWRWYSAAIKTRQTSRHCRLKSSTSFRRHPHVIIKLRAGTLTLILTCPTHTHTPSTCTSVEQEQCVQTLTNYCLISLSLQPSSDHFYR